MNFRHADNPKPFEKYNRQQSPDSNEKRRKDIKQLAYDAIDFLRVLEEDGEFRHWGEGYNKQVLEELRKDAKELDVI